ncbi:MAG: hypothetical protein AB1585_03505 [Thermodesulfobacteriota bacterium]
MNKPPQISFSFSFLPQETKNDQDLFDRPLPLSQSDFSGPVQSSWTYRRYFQAIEGVLALDNFAALKDAVACRLNLTVKTIDLEEIDIYAEKHGNWYHPVRIEVKTSGSRTTFVLNGALTEKGRWILEREVRTLMVLKDRYRYPWLPTVYFHNKTDMLSFPNEEGLPSFGFFIADWFEGFLEFHLSSVPGDPNPRLLLWDGNQDPSYLSKDQEGEVYRQIAKILTCYYNPITYEQIFPWHHGAGDFVVRAAGGEIEVRLVTVRQYGPLVDPQRTNPEEALLLFFLNLTLRMRLDRLDGVGETTWAGDHCLASTYAGFLDGLRIMEGEGALPPSFLSLFFNKLEGLSLEDLTERFSAILDSYNPQAPDFPVVKENMVSHLLWVSKVLDHV